MSAAFTPGPWEVGPVLGFDRSIVAVDRPHSPVALAAKGGRISEEREANANLIAAAPELYEACEGILANIESGDPITSLEAAWLREALVKARGGR